MVFGCTKCSALLKTKEALERHDAIRHLDPIPEYYCPACEVKSWSKGYIEAHYLRKHAKKRPIWARENTGNG